MSPRRRTLRGRAALVAICVTGVCGASISPALAARSTRPKVRVRVQPNFTVAIPQDAQTITAGGEAAYPVVITANSAFRGNIALDFPNLAGGLDGRVRATDDDNGYEMTVATSPLLSSGSGVYRLRARGGGLTREALFRLTIQAVPATTTSPAPVTTTPGAGATTTTAVTGDFDVRADNAERGVYQGDTAQFGFTLQRTGGFAAPVTFRVDGLPTGATANFSPNPTTGGTVLYVTPGPSTPRRAYLLAVTATVGTLTRGQAVRLVVRQPGDFRLSVVPAQATVAAGLDAVYGLTVQGVGNQPAPDVELSVTGLPPGAAGLFATNPAAGPTALTVTTPSTLAAGTYPFTLTARSGNINRTLGLTLIVRTTPGYGLAAQPASVRVSRGEQATISVAVTRRGGFTGPIAFAVRGAPQDATVNIESSAVAANVRISVPATSPAGVYPLQISGTSGSLSATVVVELAVT